MTALEELKELRRQIDVAIGLIEAKLVRDMTGEEKARYSHVYGKFDVVVGDYIIRRIRSPYEGLTQGERDEAMRP